MEKIKPLLVYKFWIFFVLALLLPTTGWILASGDFAAKTQQRWSKLDTAFKTKYDVANTPNDKWVAKLTQMNTVRDKYLKESTHYLWERQKPYMTWPPENVQGLMANVPYRGKVPPFAPDFYRLEYEREFWRLYTIVNPYNRRTGEGTMALPFSAIQIQPLDAWDQMLPTSREMWDAQEEIWLQASLLEALAAVNREADAQSVNDAPIIMLERIDLVEGGSRTNLDDPNASSGGQMPRKGARFSTNDSDEDAFDGEGGGLGRGRSRRRSTIRNRRQFNSPVRADWNIGEEFGDVPGPPVASNGQPTALDDAPSAYIDVGNKGLPFQVRGFKLHLVMDHRYVPQLLAQLSEIEPWPTEVVRCHIVSRNPTETGRSSGGSRRGGRGSASHGDDDEEDMGLFSRNSRKRRPGLGLGGNAVVSAMAGKHVANVVIGGLMTMYLPPDEEKAAAANTNTPTPPVTGQSPGADTADTPAMPGNPQPAADSPSAEQSPPDQETKTKPADKPAPIPEADNVPEKASEEKTSPNKTGSETKP